MVQKFCFLLYNFLLKQATKHQRSLLRSCGTDVILRPGARISNPEQVSIGNHCDIGESVVLMGAGGITIGDYTMIATNSLILTGTHTIDTERVFHQRTEHHPVHIGNHVWIGAGAIILPGISIGDHAIVGDGAVVTKDVAPRSTVVGVPARPLPPHQHS